MDDRAIKKLVITVIVAIAIIMLFKYMLTRSYSNLNKISSARKPPQAVLLNVTRLPDAPAASPISAVPASVGPAPAEPASIEPAFNEPGSNDPVAATPPSAIPAAPN